VHVALAIDGVPSIGAVALPGLGEVCFGCDQPGALPTCRKPPRMVVSRTRPAAEAVSGCREARRGAGPMGSAGAKAMAVVRGEAEIYLTPAANMNGTAARLPPLPQRTASTSAASMAARCLQPARYVYMPDLLICRKEHARPVLDLIMELAA
jgi:3'(2'), 5'-bisphosphate nucleotidase